MAIGTGNMWRFPRIAAQNGGAAFLIPWFIFLFSWSLPLLIAEFAIGRGARRGVVGAFADLIGRRYAWMGGFIAVTSVMILFYYSVVTGWTLKYVLASLSGQLDGPGAEQYWVDYSASVWQPLGFHAVSVLIGAAIISRGVVAGIERANKVLIPLLLGLLIVAVVRAVTLPGAGRGLRFLFNPDLTLLWSYRTWLEALTQSAWSTGAGWGLILTYAIYMRADEDVVVNATAIGLGNNTASVLAGMAVVPTAFAILSQSDALDAMAAGNTGLTFIWIPQLFARIPGGGVFLPLFFLALFCAALSSLIAMIELATRILMDGGMTRRRAVRWVVAATIVGGAPSAASVTIFENQGLGLGAGADDQRSVRRPGRHPVRCTPVQRGTGQRGRERHQPRSGVRVGADLPDPGRVRRHVRMVDVSDGGGDRPDRMVEPVPDLLPGHLPAAVGAGTDLAGGVQPADRRRQPPLLAAPVLL